MDPKEIPHVMMEERRSAGNRDPLPVAAKSLLSCTWRLLLTVFIASVLSFSNGTLTAYVSPAVPNLNENRNPFRVTDDQQSWIASLLCLGAAAGGLASGPVCDLLGRKMAMIVTSLFIIVGMTVITAATSIMPFYVGYTLAAFFAQTSWTASLLYVSEVTPADVRGTCMALGSTAYTMGMVVSYAMGVPLAWNWLAVFVAALYAAPNLVLVFLPESPRWFLMKGNKEAAVHGIKWLRGGSCDFVEVRAIEESLPDASDRHQCDVTAWRELFTDRKNLTSLFVCSMLFVFAVFSGNLVLQLFTVTIFEYVGATQIDPNMQSIISGLFLVAGSLLCPPLIDRVGRKALFIASSVVVCISMASAAAFFQVLEKDADYAHQNLYWLPVVGLSVGNLGYAVGLLPVPYILSCEMFSTNVRGCAQTVLTAITGLASFACIKTFINIQDGVGTSGAFFVYAGVCAVATLFAIIFVREAKLTVMR